MGSGFQCDSTAGDPAENLVDSLRCCRQAVLQKHVTCLIQNAVMAGSVSQVQTGGQLLLPENVVTGCLHSANLLHRRSPYSLCLEHVETLGAYRIPRRPAFSSHLVSRLTGHVRSSAHFSGNHVNQDLALWMVTYGFSSY